MCYSALIQMLTLIQDDIQAENRYELHSHYTSSEILSASCPFETSGFFRRTVLIISFVQSTSRWPDT